MTPAKFRYQMCPIRFFKGSLIKFVDAFNHFVFAADDQGTVAVFLINENDLENDDDTLREQSF